MSDILVDGAPCAPVPEAKSAHATFYLEGRDLNRRTTDQTSITAKIADTIPVIVIGNRIMFRYSTGKRYPPFRGSGYPKNRPPDDKGGELALREINRRRV